MFRSMFSWISKKRPVHPIEFPQVSNTLDETLLSGRFYRQYWNDKLIRARNAKDFRDFNTKLFFFLIAVTNKWLKDSRISIEHRSEIQTMIDELSYILDLSSQKFERLNLEQRLEEELEDLAKPVLNSSPESPDYSGWTKTSFSHSKKLLQAGMDLPLPR